MFDTPAPRLNRVPHPDDFSAPELLPYAIDWLHLAPEDWAGIERKFWEWAMVLAAADRFDYLRRDVSALGVAAGYEPLPFVLSNHVGMSVASDLYGQTAFVEASADMLRYPPRTPYWSRPYERARLLVMNADATDLPFGDGSFDMLFSCSSVEHFGPSDKIRQSMREAERVLRPGGMYALSVDYLYDSPQAWLPRDRRDEHIREFLTKRDIEALIVSTPGLSLREPVDYAVPKHLVTNLFDLETMAAESGTPESGRHRPHIWLHWRNHYLTSLFLVLFKDGVVGVERRTTQS